MNDMQSIVKPEARLVIVLPAEDQLGLEWARVLDCGALGPQREWPILFHQGADDWGDGLSACAGSDEGDENA